jgi:hypothetical protein
MRYARSMSGRITWTVIEGRLHESSPDYAPFTLCATDTLILLQVLEQEQEAIEKAAHQEQAGMLETYPHMRHVYEEKESEGSVSPSEN